MWMYCKSVINRFTLKPWVTYSEVCVVTSYTRFISLVHLEACCRSCGHKNTIYTIYSTCEFELTPTFRVLPSNNLTHTSACFAHVQQKEKLPAFLYLSDEAAKSLQLFIYVALILQFLWYPLIPLNNPRAWIAICLRDGCLKKNPPAWLWRKHSGLKQSDLNLWGKHTNVKLPNTAKYKSIKYRRP